MANVHDFELINSDKQDVGDVIACAHWDGCGIDFVSGCKENDVCIIDFSC